MRIKDTILTALQNLGRRKVRTVLTSIGVFVGILTIVTMVSLGIGIQTQITDTIKALGLETVLVTPKMEEQPSGASNRFARQRPEKPITAETIKQFGNIEGVASVEVFVGLPAAPEMTLMVDGKTFPIALRDDRPETRIFRSQEGFLAGRGFTNAPGERGVILSQRLLRGAGYSRAQFEALVGKPATLDVTAPRGEKATFQTVVVGVSGAVFGADLANGDKLDLKKWWYNDPNVLQTDGYSGAMVHADTLQSAARVSREIEDGMGFSAATLQNFLDQVSRIFTILQIMLSSVGLLALFVASIGIVNTMIMAIYERTREIGILKALGSSNGDVLRMFMVEAGLIGLLGGVVGVVSGWALGLGLNALILEYLKREQIPISAPFFVVTWELVAQALLFATLVGIVAGLYPAFRAARLDPLAALRHE